MPDARPLVLLGNANVGKSVVFGYLTGAYVFVSNYPGTTVEIARGRARHAGAAYEIFDTPGINSVIPHSVDEQVTRDILLEHPDAPVVQIADGKNLKRALLVTSQLAELGRRVVLVLNMADEAQAAGLEIDARALGARLGIPVLLTVATERRGLDQILPAAAAAGVPRLPVAYDDAVRAEVDAVAACLPEMPGRSMLAQMLLTEDVGLEAWLDAHLDPGARARLRDRLAGRPGDRLLYAVTRARLRAVQPILEEAVRARPAPASSLLRRAGDVCQHPVWGLAVLALVLYGMYAFVGGFGAGTCVDFVESRLFAETPAAYAARLRDAGVDPGPILDRTDAAAVAEALRASGLSDEAVAEGELLPGWIGPFKGVNWYAGAAFDRLGVPLLSELFVGPFGLLTVGVTYAFAIVMPIVTFFFLAFGLLEDSGYLPRLAVMANDSFRRIGLNGRAVLPMVLGLGCDTMATLTTRILYTRKERLIATLLLAIVVPCSAQLGVILGITAQTPSYVFVLYVAILLLQVFIIGALSARVLPGETSDFLLEIPPFRVPVLRNIVWKTLYRLEWFLKEAVPLFVLGTFILFVADKTGALRHVIRAAEPVVVGLLGLPAETARAFVMGFLRRDYGAAGLFALFEQGRLSPLDVLVSLVTLTLFIPCIANFFVIVREQGARRAGAMLAFSLAYAVAAGAATNLAFQGIIP